MREWNSRGRKIHIPDMEKLNKLRCKVCGKEFIPQAKKRYTAKENMTSGGLVEAFSWKTKDPDLFDCFDCPQCGCQMVINRRLDTLK